MTVEPRNRDLEAALALVATARPSAGRTVVVAIDGPSGSGKTSTAQALAAALGNPPVVHMDDLYPGWDGLAQAVPHLHDQVLAPLARGQRAAYRRFDWDRGEYAEEHEVPPVPVLVVEGVGAGAMPAGSHVAVLIWVEADRAVRFSRGMARDGEAYRPHWERWARQEDALFAADRTRERADLVIDTTDRPAADRLPD